MIGSKSSSAEVKCSALFVFAVPCAIISPLKFSLGIKLYNSIPYERIPMTFSLECVHYMAAQEVCACSPSRMACLEAFFIRTELCLHCFI